MPDGTFETARADREAAVEAHDKVQLRLWLRLLTCANPVEREVRSRLRARFGITLPRFDLLAQLDRAPDGLTMGELSERLMVSNGNVTGLTDRLVAEGLVRRTPAAHDRRTQTVRLTTAGKAAFDAMTPVHEGWIDELFGDLDGEDMAALHDLLGRLKTSAEQARRP